VAVLVDGDPAAKRLVRSLIDAVYRLDAIVEQDSVGRLATARMISPGADRLGVVVDVLFATAGIESEIVAATEVLEVRPVSPADRPPLFGTPEGVDCCAEEHRREPAGDQQFGPDR
jgi:hypothetical protein